MNTDLIPEAPPKPVNYDQSSSKRVLEPIERISEVLFGLIMVLTFTCSFSVAEAGRLEVRGMLLGALGCNLAWGLIDAIMYLMGCLAEAARSLRTLRLVRNIADPEKAHRVIADAMPSAMASVLREDDLKAIRQQMAQAPEPPTHPRLTKRDWIGAFGVFLLVVVTTFPVVVPFIFVQNVLLAKRLSTAIPIILLCLTGYACCRYTGNNPRGIGLSMGALGCALVGPTILLA